MVVLVPSIYISVLKAGNRNKENLPASFNHLRSWNLIEKITIRLSPVNTENIKLIKTIISLMLTKTLLVPLSRYIEKNIAPPIHIGKVIKLTHSNHFLPDSLIQSVIKSLLFS
jgi:hypothetical protein